MCSLFFVCKYLKNKKQKQKSIDQLDLSYWAFRSSTSSVHQRRRASFFFPLCGGKNLFLDFLCFGIRSCAASSHSREKIHLLNLSTFSFSLVSLQREHCFRYDYVTFLSRFTSRFRHFCIAFPYFPPCFAD